MIHLKAAKKINPGRSCYKKKKIVTVTMNVNETYCGDHFTINAYEPLCCIAKTNICQLYLN